MPRYARGRHIPAAPRRRFGLTIAQVKGGIFYFCHYYAFKFGHSIAFRPAAENKCRRGMTYARRRHFDVPPACYAARPAEASWSPSLISGFRPRQGYRIDGDIRRFALMGKSGLGDARTDCLRARRGAASARRIITAFISLRLFMLPSFSTGIYFWCRDYTLHREQFPLAIY